MRVKSSSGVMYPRSCGRHLFNADDERVAVPRPRRTNAGHFGREGLGILDRMAKYRVNKRGVAKARKLIDAHQYRVRSRWADVQPRAAEQNRFLKANGWQE